ncbi:MAG TPA: iron-containing alcohol dehydrogenase [Candidatus Limiplasma sp.]|mgnify:CR=1 FL=1|nr:iron-containing alcohol dehydrogenase [Candidatus Limiplasma sp.]HRX09277.1 iron-containing alcohol dehydrogenase [Candidatus Limiplasma sp.]
MLDFTFCSPTQFYFGRDTQYKAGALCAAYGRKALLHYGGGSVIKSGLLDAVKRSLESAGVAWVELGGVQPNPRDTLVYEGIRLCKREGVDVVLAVGGGSVIDSAKAIAAGIKYDGDFWDLYSHKATMTDILPLGVILTLPAAGSEASNSSVVTKEADQLKRFCDSELMRPKFSILNPELTFTLPPFQTACGCVDMMAHVMERYFTNTPEVEVTDRMSEGIMRAIMKYAKILMKNPEDYDARANVMWAGSVAHCDVLGVGRQQDWSTHMMEHELSGLYDVAHGAGLAVMFPAFLKYQLPFRVQRVAQFAVRVFDVSMDFEKPERTALEGIRRLEAYYREIGMPTSFKEINAKEEDIEFMAGKCLLNNGDTLGHFHPLTRKEIAEVYRLACQ